jgi:hypothetical protein
MLLSTVFKFHFNLVLFALACPKHLMQSDEHGTRQEPAQKKLHGSKYYHLDCMGILLTQHLKSARGQPIAPKMDKVGRASGQVKCKCRFYFLVVLECLTLEIYSFLSNWLRYRRQSGQSTSYFERNVDLTTDSEMCSTP